MKTHTHHQPVQSATALPVAPLDNQRRRIHQYTIAMGIRMICIALVYVFAFVFPTVWVLIPMLGAVVLPYIAVVLANVGSQYASAPVNPVNNALVRRDDTP